MNFDDIDKMKQEINREIFNEFSQKNETLKCPYIFPNSGIVLIANSIKKVITKFNDSLS